MFSRKLKPKLCPFCSKPLVLCLCHKDSAQVEKKYTLRVTPDGKVERIDI